MKRWQVFIGVGLLLASSLAAALSLGRVRGTPLLGRGLDVAVQSSLAAQESMPEATCFAVELFYGDSRVSPSAISVVPERSAAGEWRIRIRSSVVVDEPVVTLFVRTSCGPSVSRRYVLLAELLTETDTPVALSSAAAPATSATPAPPIPLSPSVPSTRRDDPQPSSTAPNASTGRMSRQERAAQRARNKAEREASAASVPSAAVAGTAAAKAERSLRSGKPPSASANAAKTKPRLQLDLLDLSSLEPNLRQSFELSIEPSSDAAVRAQALALWRSLNATPEDALRDSQRLEALEAQMRQSLEQGKRQSQDIAALTTQLQAAQRERYFNPFTWALSLLTLIALGLSIWLWRRQAQDDRPWWRGAAASHGEQQEEQLWNHLNEEMMQDVDVGLVNSTPVSDSGSSNPDSAGQALNTSSRNTNLPEHSARKAAVGVSSSDKAKTKTLSTVSPNHRGMARFEDTKPPASLDQNLAAKKALLLPDRDMGYSDFANSNFASSRLVSTEELFDIQEQADFFMSLDQPEQAIAVLKNHITDNVETSALAYMDLFDIYHRTGREDDYQQLREEFNRVFNAQVPEFSNYSDQSMGLEEYPQAMQAIMLAWPRPQEALDLIEEYIFRQPDPQQQPFDMLAYRELMLMYAMTKDLVKSQSAESMLPTIAALKDAISGKPAASDDLGISFDLDNLALPAQLTESGPASSPPQTQQAESGSMGKDLPSLDFDLSQMDAPQRDLAGQRASERDSGSV